MKNVQRSFAFTFLHHLSRHHKHDMQRTPSARRLPFGTDLLDASSPLELHDDGRLLAPIQPVPQPESARRARSTERPVPAGMHVTVPVAPKLISNIRAAIAAAARDKSNQHVKTGKETPRSMSQSRSQVSLLKKHEPLFVPASSTAPVTSDTVPAEKHTSAPALHQSKSQPLLMQHLAESFRATMDSSRRSQEHEMSVRRIRLLENENKRLTDKLHVVENETAIKIRSLEGQLKLNLTKPTPFQIRTNKLPAHLLGDDRVITLEKKCAKLEADAVASKEELLKSQHEWNDWYEKAMEIERDIQTQLRDSRSRADHLDDVNDALQTAITELHKQLAAERDKSAHLSEQLIAQKSTFASKEDDLESEMLQTLEAQIATQPAPSVPDSADSTPASADLVAARAQIQSLLEQLSTTRAQLRDGADANMRIQQQWALERDRADSAWEKSQQQLAALNSELSETKATLQATRSDHQNLLVAHQELEVEVRNAETRLKSMPEQLMFSGDIESSESSVSLLDGFVTVVDAPLFSYSDQNANTMLVAPSPTMASAPLAPAFFASASSSARSTFDSAPSTHSSLSGTTSTGATVLYSDELEPASRNGSALFSPASSGPTSLSNRIAIGIDTSSPVNIPSAIDDFSPHCQLDALISALHLNIQQRATRLSAALSAAQDEIRVVRSSTADTSDDVQPLLQAARQEASSAVERLASLQRQYDALTANQSATSNTECTSCAALKTEIDRLTQEVDERQQRIAACESQLHVVDQQVSLFEAEAKQKESRLRQRIALLEDTAKKSKNGNAAAK